MTSKLGIRCQKATSSKCIPDETNYDPRPTPSPIKQLHLLLIFMPPKEGRAPDLLPSAKEVVLGLLLLMMSIH